MRAQLILICIILQIVFISFFLHTYLPYNYHLQYTIHDVYDEISSKTASNATTNLISYFFHVKQLDPQLFTQKEIKHFEDVRVLYDGLFILTLMSIFFLIKLKPKKEQIIKALEKARYYVLAPLVILPIFSYFWNSLFHTILFNNSYWITKPGELSYYLFPIEFFSYTLISIIILSEIIIYITLYELKYKRLIE